MKQVTETEPKRGPNRAKNVIKACAKRDQKRVQNVSKTIPKRCEKRFQKRVQNVAHTGLKVGPELRNKRSERMQIYFKRRRLHRPKHADKMVEQLRQKC